MLKRLAEIKTILVLIALMWLAFGLSFVIPAVDNLGIVPRTWHGLVGVICSPFLHANTAHITGNTMGLLAFGVIFAILNGAETLKTTVVIALASGILTWVIGRSANHIGASGLVFGLYGYLLAFGFFSRNILALVLSVLLLVSYGGIMFGILPIQRGISWEAHLSGFAFGWFYARLRATKQGNR